MRMFHGDVFLGEVEVFSIKPGAEGVLPRGSVPVTSSRAWIWKRPRRGSRGRRGWRRRGGAASEGPRRRTRLPRWRAVSLRRRLPRPQLPSHGSDPQRLLLAGLSPSVAPPSAVFLLEFSGKLGFLLLLPLRPLPLHLLLPALVQKPVAVREETSRRAKEVRGAVCGRDGVEREGRNNPAGR